MDGGGSDKEAYIFIKALTDLQQTSRNETGMIIGAGVTLGEMKDVLNKCIQELPEDKTRLFTQIVRALEPIESEQILNAAVRVRTLLLHLLPNQYVFVKLVFLIIFQYHGLNLKVFEKFFYHFFRQLAGISPLLLLFLMSYQS